jgi:peptidyl-prolyl cis-trans isomerase SurA
VKRQERIAILPSHILINEGLDIDSAKVAARADSIVNLLRKGYSFTRLAEENSDDPATAPRGGKMGAYYSRSTKFEGSGKQISPLLENELFRLKDGEFSDKILSEFGYHILRRDSTKNYDETKEKEEVKKIYKRLYYEEDKQTLLNELKDQYGFKLNNPVLDEFLSKVDTTKTNLDSAWLKNVPADIYKKDLYSMGTKSTSLGDFVEKFDNAPDMRGLATSREGITRAINKQITPVIFDEATKNLEKEYPDFAALMREFHDGILLFKAEAMEVWDKLKFDSVLAHAYYDSTKTKYWTEPVYNLTEVYLLSDSTANDVYKKAMAGENLEDLAANNTQRSGYREKKGKWEKINPKNSKLAMLVKENNGQTGQILKPLPFEKGFSVIKVDLVEPSRPKTFEEAIPDFAPILQDQVQKRLTEQWLAKIKEKYPVTIYDKNIDSYLKKGKKGK